MCALLLTLLGSTVASAQRRVTGRVTGTGGEAVAGASVVMQGTTLGVTTAEDGRFTLTSVPVGSQVLVVRRIGYRRVNLPLATGQDAVEIKLEKDVLLLEAQIVTGQATTVSTVTLDAASYLTLIGSP